MIEATKKVQKDSGDKKKLPPWLQGKVPKTGAPATGSSKTTKTKKMGKGKSGKC